MIDISTASDAVLSLARSLQSVDHVGRGVSKLFLAEARKDDLPLGITPVGPEGLKFGVTIIDEGIIVTKNNVEAKTLSREELDEVLTPALLSLVRTLEASIQKNYELWQAVYPERKQTTDPVARARIEQQLKDIVADIRGDFERLVKLLRKLGIELDESYTLWILELLSWTPS